MMYWNDATRDYKWAVPGVLTIILIVICARLYTSGDPSAEYWIMLFGGLAVLFAAMMLVNLWIKISDHWENLHERHQAALSTTPLVLLADSMKQMHPEAVKVLNRFGVRTTWDVNINHGQRDWILQGTNVHFGFVEYVLSRSNGALMPKRRLAEGSKKWDPDGLVPDRQQYDELEVWLFSRLIVTRSHGDWKPAEFIPPWTPQMVLEVMGLTGEQELYRPEEGAMKDLSGNAGKSETRQANGKPVGEVIDASASDLTAAELAAIAAEETRYQKTIN